MSARPRVGFRGIRLKNIAAPSDCSSLLPEVIVGVTASLVAQVELSLRRLGVSADGIVVAVSGGPDRVALLRALASLPTAGRLIVAQLNHQLRGPESDADEAFVRALPESLQPGMELRCERIDVAAQARTEGANVEAVARRVRYDWLARVAKECQARWVATGHTADDQAETVLHRLLRGTGLKGLRGIATRRSLAERVELIRPLLGVTRAAVMEYLREMGQAYRTDSSNADRGYTRNRIRHELLPLLAQQYNPAIAAVLCRLAEQADEAYRAEAEQA